MLNEQFVEVYLHGPLKQFSAEPIRLSGYSVSDIISGLCQAIPELRSRNGAPKWVISVLGYEYAESLTLPMRANQKELHIFPEFSGGKSGGAFVKIAIAAVIVAAIIAFPQTLGATIFAGGTTTWGSLLGNIAASLALGGLLELISPQPKADSFGNQSDPAASRYLGAAGNTVKIGTRIPIIYGRMKVFGHYLSIDIDAKDVSDTTTDATSGNPIYKSSGGGK